MKLDSKMRTCKKAPKHSRVTERAPETAVDFTQPLDPVSINGFPIKFKPKATDGDTTLWVPTGISRNNPSKGWRIKIQHAHGSFSKWVPDQGRSILESLIEAWEILSGELWFLEPRISQEKWRVRPGPERVEDTETGVTGLIIARARAKRHHGKAISVRVVQRVKTPNGKSKAVSVDTLHISESVYESFPSYHQMRFERALCEGVALRKVYINAYAEQGGPVSKKITMPDVKNRDVPETPPKLLDLGEIFSSF